MKIILFEAIAVMTGTIIGAGILGIPYVFAQAGFWTGSLVLAIVALAMLLLKLMYGEMTLRTRGNHQISGYTEIYLGKLAKHFMSFILIASIYGALLAYLIGQGEVIQAISGAPTFWASIVFYAIFSIFILIGVSIIKKSELIMSAFIFFIVIAIAILTHDHIDLANLKGFSWSQLLIPYGVLLFASSGIVAVPELRLILKRREKFMKRAIIWGCALPPVIYFLFAALVISVSGVKVTEIASVGLGQLLGWKMILIANIFAFFTMATSFLTLGLALHEIYQFDYKLSRRMSWLLVVAVPLILFLSGARDFVQVIGLVGALGIGIAGFFEVITFWVARKKGKRKPEYAIPNWLSLLGGSFVILLFMFGFIYTFFSLL